MANPTSRGQQRDKPFRDALRLEIAGAEDNPRSLRKIAAALLDKAVAGDVQAAIQVRDTLDGKPAQAITGDDELDPIRVIHEVRRLLVDPAKT
jgi:hypothetical protein